ncbi:probable N-acetyltransferase HLS1 isoform X2 [Prosopis cineraria]|uniref:probable N-acetyltransferase HLS1 isoform X2 n=1 Tax=Prosopis cineraria TaxID=364024 RepID=UPI0024105C81|nr:probable N-acetyltransferase HLS1 isoform X2 [Prosopis cineraria]
MFANHPFSRISFYPLRLILVAEMVESGEIVGVVRGCIKTIGSHSGSLFKMGCVLGLRVSPTYRKGVGQKLVSSVEEWMVRNGAKYSFVATEKNNTASTNLFSLKCHYLNLTSLLIFVQPTSFPHNHVSAATATRQVKIQKLNIAQAISLYTRTLKHKDLYLTDMDLILKEKLSLGTWVTYYKDDGNWELDNETSNFPTSWIVFSLWNTCEADKLHVRSKSKPFRVLIHSTLNHARDKIFPCLRIPVSDSLLRPFGFLFMYGLHGVGDNLGELMECAWRFTSRLGESMKDCKVVITELGFGDPLAKLVPRTASMSCIDDLWYIKRLSGLSDEKDDDDDDEVLLKGQVRNVFVDPRDF